MDVYIGHGQNISNYCASLEKKLQQFIYHKRRKVRDEFKFFTAHLKGMQRIEFSPKNQFQ